MAFKHFIKKNARFKGFHFKNFYLVLTRILFCIAFRLFINVKQIIELKIWRFICRPIRQMNEYWREFGHIFGRLRRRRSTVNAFKCIFASRLDFSFPCIAFPNIPCIYILILSYSKLILWLLCFLCKFSSNAHRICTTFVQYSAKQSTVCLHHSLLFIWCALYSLYA